MRSNGSRCAASAPQPCDSRSSRARQRQLASDYGSLQDDLAAEAEELCRPAAGLVQHLARFLDEHLLLNQPAKVLLVQLSTCKSLDGTLQLQQRERRRHQLENDRAVFDLGAQPRDAGGKDAAVIMVHALAGRQRLNHRPTPRRLPHECRLVQQLVALQHELLVPSLLVSSESGVDAIRALPPGSGIGCVTRPSPQARQDGSRDHSGRPATPVFPRKVPIPIVPVGAMLSRYARLSGETKVANGDYALLSAPMHTIPVGEVVERSEVAQRVMRLVLHPGAYAHLQAAMPRGEWARRQRPPVLDREHARLIIGYRDQNRCKFDRLQLRLRDLRSITKTQVVCLIPP